jgi:hypothetical protein
MTCTDIQRELAAYVDGELGGAQRLLLSSHLSVCRACAREETDLRDLGELLRGAAVNAPAPAEDLRGLAGGVISRIGAELQQSWRVKTVRAFDDWRWVAVGSGAFGAAFVTVVLVFVMLYAPITRARQFNDRVGTLYVMALPDDGSSGPVMLEYGESMGQSVSDHRYAVPASFGSRAEQALVSALDASLMRHGRLVNFRDLTQGEREEVEGLLREITSLRRTERFRRPVGVTNVSGMHLYIDETVTAAGL